MNEPTDHDPPTRYPTGLDSAGHHAEYWPRFAAYHGVYEPDDQFLWGFGRVVIPRGGGDCDGGGGE